MKHLMLKNILVFLAIGLFSLVTENENNFIVAENIDRSAQCGTSNTTFQGGEVLTFELQYKWGLINMKGGQVQFRVFDNGDHYQVNSIGRTYPGIEFLFKVRDQYEAKIDKETLLPISAFKYLQEGKYRLYEELYFDHERNEITSIRGKSKETAEKRSYTMDGCMHGILSMLYYSRNLDIENYDEGDMVPVNFFMNKKIYPMQLEYVGKDERKRVRGLGLFKTIQLAPSLVTSQYFKENDKMNIWVSDDENRIPLMIETPIKVGRVRAVLSKYEGLRSDLNAKIKK